MCRRGPGFAGISIFDADANDGDPDTSDDLTVTLTLNQGGKLTVTPSSSSVSGNESSVVTLTGTQ